MQDGVNNIFPYYTPGALLMSQVANMEKKFFENQEGETIENQFYYKLRLPFRPKSIEAFERPLWEWVISHDKREYKNFLVYIAKSSKSRTAFSEKIELIKQFLSDPTFEIAELLPVEFREKVYIVTDYGKEASYRVCFGEEVGHMLDLLYDETLVKELNEVIGEELDLEIEWDKNKKRKGLQLIKEIRDYFSNHDKILEALEKAAWDDNDPVTIEKSKQDHFFCLIGLLMNLNYLKGTTKEVFFGLKKRFQSGKEKELSIRMLKTRKSWMDREKVFDDNSKLNVNIRKFAKELYHFDETYNTK